MLDEQPLPTWTSPRKSRKPQGKKNKTSFPLFISQLEVTLSTFKRVMLHRHKKLPSPMFSLHGLLWWWYHCTWHLVLFWLSREKFEQLVGFLQARKHHRMSGYSNQCKQCWSIVANAANIALSDLRMEKLFGDSLDISWLVVSTHSKKYYIVNLDHFPE